MSKKQTVNTLLILASIVSISLSAVYIDIDNLIIDVSIKI